MRGYKTRTNATLRRKDGGLIHGYKYVLAVDGYMYFGNTSKPECRARHLRTGDIAMMVDEGKWEHVDLLSQPGNQASQRNPTGSRAKVVEQT